MRVLGIETSTATGSVAVVDGDELLGEVCFCGAGRHSEQLLGNVALVLRMTGMQTGSLQGVAVGLGPGSFTGVRVALSTAKGLALGLGIPLAGVPSLKALAEGVSCWGGLVCPMVDARARRVYTALFQLGDDSMQQMDQEALRDLLPWIQELRQLLTGGGGLSLPLKSSALDIAEDLASGGPCPSPLPPSQETSGAGVSPSSKSRGIKAPPPCLSQAGRLPVRCTQTGGRQASRFEKPHHRAITYELREAVLFVGDGAVAYGKLIEEVMGHLARFVPAESNYPRAATVARLGCRRLGRGDSDDLDSLLPRYLQEAKAVRDMVRET